MTVMAFDPARNRNGKLMADVHELGYLEDGWKVLDPTHGKGNFWTVYKPVRLTATDLNPDKSPIGTPVDFTDMPWPAMNFHAVVFDPPYQMNGSASKSKATAAKKEAFGVDDIKDAGQRLKLIVAGLVECARVCEQVLMVKSQDAVYWTEIIWLSRLVMDTVEECGFVKVDELHVSSYQEQPDGTSQQHARRNYSTLQIFKRIAAPGLQQLFEAV